MHDKHNEVFDRIIKRTFGPNAELAGQMGTPTKPGDVQIILDGRPIGIGRTFEDAFQRAQTTVRRLAGTG